MCYGAVGYLQCRSYDYYVISSIAKYRYNVYNYHDPKPNIGRGTSFIYFKNHRHNLLFVFSLICLFNLEI